MATVLNLSEQDLMELCQRYLYDKTKDCRLQDDKIDLKIIGYHLKPLSTNPAGFLGLHQYLTIQVAYKLASTDNYETQTFTVFTKSAPKEIASRMSYLEEFGVFRKEIVCYRKVLTALENIFGAVSAKCFYAANNVIILQDLTQNGFKMAAGRDGLLDYQHLKCVVKTLARLHAASLIYETKFTARLDQIYKEAVKENAYPTNITENHVRYQNVSNGIKVFQELIKTIPRYQAHLTVILKELPLKVWKIFELVQSSGKYRNVFSHGDLWANNIMFRYDDDDFNKPLEARFVDFQLARYSPPMVDLITVLTIPTKRQFRKNHLLDLIQQYYEELKELLKTQRHCIEDLLPFKEFYASLGDYRMCGLIESALFSHLTILPGQLAQDLTSTADGFSDFFNRKRIDICLKAFHSDPLYRERLCDMLEDLVDSFILDKEEK